MTLEKRLEREANELRIALANRPATAGFHTVSTERLERLIDLLTEASDPGALDQDEKETLEDEIDTLECMLARKEDDISDLEDMLDDAREALRKAEAVLSGWEDDAASPEFEALMVVRAELVRPSP